jgi:hypothetical protein
MLYSCWVGGVVMMPGKRLNIIFLVEVTLSHVGVPSEHLINPKGVAFVLVRIFASLLASGIFWMSPVNLSQLLCFILQMELA